MFVGVCVRVLVTVGVLVGVLVGVVMTTTSTAASGVHFRDTGDSTNITIVTTIAVAISAITRRRNRTDPRLCSLRKYL